MNRFRRVIVSTCTLMVVLLSAVPVMLWHAPKALAGDCTTVGPATQLSIYTTNLASFLRPSVSLDPQTIVIGQQSTRMEVEIEDVNGCAVPAPAATQVALTISDHAGDLLSVGGTNNNETFNFTIATGNSRGGFFVKGKGVATSTLSVITRPTSVVQLTSGTQTILVTAPAPDVTKLLFTNNAHGVADSVSGSAGAVVASSISPGITIQVSTSDGITVLGSTPANANGSFSTVATGDDQYRQVLVQAIYTGGAGTIVSSGVLFDQTYPAIVSNLSITHGSGDRPHLAWTATEAGATFRIYRALANPPPILTEANFLATTLIPDYTDASIDFTMGTAYRYVVKQVIAGSYTPEFVPTADSRLDISSVVISPGPSSSTSATPSVAFTVSSALYTSFQANPTVLKATYTDLKTGATYTASVSVSPAFFGLASAPYTSQTGVILPTLPDGQYSVVAKALDTTVGINDTYTVSSSYTIDSLAPAPVVLAKLRYQNAMIVGLDGAAESGTFVDMYNGHVVDPSKRIDTVVVSATGTFTSGPITPPADGVVALVVRDVAGNLSAITLFDLTHIPAPPVAAKLTMQQNKPGLSDAVVGATGAVPGGSIVRIYITDPLGNSAAVAFREVVALGDGSFSQEVGDSVASTFYVAVYSGAGFLSDSVPLANAISIAVPVVKATPHDARVSLGWNAVSGAIGYRVDVYTAANNILIKTASLAASQTTMQVLLENGVRYTFVVYTFDAYGNVNQSFVEATPVAAHAVLASAPLTTEPKAPIKQTITQTPQQPPTEVAVPDVSTPAPAEPTTRNWASVIILVVGLALLLVAAISAYVLRTKKSTEIPIVVTTTKTKSSTTKLRKQPTTETKAVDAPKQDDNSPPPKPRW